MENKFKVYTDHSPLREIKTKNVTEINKNDFKSPEIDFQLFYTPGKKNVVADTRSKESITEETKETIQIEELLWKSIITCGIFQKEEQVRTFTTKL